MKMTMRSHLFFVICALGSGCAYAQSDATKLDATQSDLSPNVNNTIYLQNAHASLSEGNTLGQNPKTVYGTPAYNQMIGDFQSYKDSMSMVIDGEADTFRQRAEFNKLLDVADQAVKARDGGEQVHLFGNYLYDSRNFIIRYPGYPGDTHLWVLRAVAALRLNKPVTGYEAGRVLFALPKEERADPHVERILDVLDKQGWLARDKIAGGRADPATPVADRPAK